MALAVIQPIDTEGLSVALRVALEQEVGATQRALFARLFDHAQDVLYCKLVVRSRIFGSTLLPVFDHIPFQPGLDQSAAWGRLESRRAQGALNVARWLDSHNLIYQPYG